jgi:flagellar hook-length control protein FliK
MSSIAPAAPISPANAPTLASNSPSANAVAARDPGSFGATLATVDKPPPRKSTAQHGQTSAATGASVPPRGNPLPQPPVPPVPPGSVTPGVLVPMIPLLGTLSAAGLAGAQSPAIGALAAPVTTPELPKPAAAPPEMPASGTTAATRPMIQDRMPAQVLAGSKDAGTTVRADGTAKAQTATIDAADSVAPLDLAAQNAAAATAPAAADSAGNDDAAALAADRIAALPAGAVAPAKNMAAAEAHGSGGAASTVAAQDSHAVATAIVQVPIAPVLERHTRDGATNAPGDLLVNASASAAAGEANVRGLAAQDAASMQNAPPPVPNLNSPQLPDQLAAHVSYLVDQNLNGATLQVNPPQLGPIEMRVSIDAGHAQVWLTAHSAATVDALQQTSSKLRDMLSSQGFGQVSVDVSQRSFEDRSTHAEPYVWQGGAEPVMQAPRDAPASWSPRSSSGGLDAYA